MMSEASGDMYLTFLFKEYVQLDMMIIVHRGKLRFLRKCSLCGFLHLFKIKTRLHTYERGCKLTTLPDKS